jgi:outer membrane lipoprotein-sorting protein
MISPLPTGSEGSTSLLFLMDRGNLTRDFTPSLTGDQPAGQWRLTLVPKRPDPDVTSLVLVVDRATFKLTGFEIKDDQGGTTTMKFQNLKENVGLRDQDFVKGLPRNAKIIK